MRRMCDGSVSAHDADCVEELTGTNSHAEHLDEPIRVKPSKRLIFPDAGVRSEGWKHSNAACLLTSLLHAM